MQKMRKRLRRYDPQDCRHRRNEPASRSERRFQDGVRRRSNGGKSVFEAQFSGRGNSGRGSCTGIRDVAAVLGTAY